MDLTIPVTGKEPAKGFDYSVMDKDTAKFAETKAVEIWERHDQMVSDWVGNANSLNAVRGRCVQGRDKKGQFNSEADTFLQWVKGETPYTPKQVASMLHALKSLPTDARATVGHRVMNRLTAGDIDETVVSTVLERDGDPVSFREAAKINRAAREMDSGATLPTPVKANEIARDTGKPQVANDGRLYLGLPPEEVAKGKAENKLDFGIIDGVAFFSSIQISPEEWLKQDSSALQEWSVTNPPHIATAANWLKDLAKAWSVYAKGKAINGEHHEDS